jgi:hypothetical protein
MKFEISQTFRTNRSKQEVVNFLEGQLRRVSERVTRSGDTVTAKSIEASFGSINRADSSVFSVREKERGFICVADVNYRPSIFFWVLLIALFFTWVLWLIPIGFYLVQKKTVRSAIADVFSRVKDEFESDYTSHSQSIDSLEKLAILKEKGVLTEAEFDREKRAILSKSSAAGN